MLWAGGLYGLNSVCKASLSQATSAVPGAADAAQLAQAKGAVAVILPEQRLGEWDRKGADLHNPESPVAFLDAVEAALPEYIETYRIPCHINDDAFAEKALKIFDDWCADGKVKY